VAAVRGVDISEGRVVGEVTAPEKDYLAFFGELDYEVDDSNTSCRRKFASRKAQRNAIIKRMPRLLVCQHVPHEILGTLNRC
jgi:hypothetical protein